jgi:signal transduction histidine kinase
VLITPELHARPSRPPDHEAENAALRALARTMAEDPENLLQTLAQTGLRLCRAESAGVSILETGADGCGFFRWGAMAGVLGPRLGQTGPLHSPCGTCLERGASQLYAFPGRHYAYPGFQPAETVVEALVVPFPERTGLKGTIWVVAHSDRRRFDAEDDRLMRGLAAFTAAAVRLREADRRRTDGLAALAHELRNPLTPVQTGMALLRAQRADADAFSRVATMMDGQIAQLARLVTDLKDVAQITHKGLELRRERLDLFDIVRNATESVRPSFERAGVRLAVDLPARPAMAHVDGVRVAQVLGNLLHNGLKYTPAGGGVWVTAALERDRVAITVTDTGRGIPAEHLPLIFDLFFRGDTGCAGLGVGLTLARRLAEMHHGTLTAASDGPGRGSAFALALPLLPTDPAPLRAPETGGAGTGGGGWRVLVVDDNAAGAEALAELLALQGHAVRTAFDGEAALREAEDFRPALVLMDLQMPRMDGYAAAAAMRARPWATKIVLVALTGWGGDADRRRAREAGFDRYLVKPVTVEALRGLLSGAPPG